jgi:hypothetical protein
MTSIKRVGFFHFGGNDKSDPVGSLQTEIGKFSGVQLTDSLIVLPEAFNVRGGFYNAEPNLDPHAYFRLLNLAISRRMTFVAGLIDGVRGANSAYLIGGTCSPILLSRKRSPGWDRLYTPSMRDETTAVVHGGLGITALICDDASYIGQSAEGRNEIIARVKKSGARRNLLCVPAHMSITDSVGVAALWWGLIPVVIANGCATHPSIIRYGDVEQVSPRYRDENEIKLCDL